jgi:hypothetical protein
MLSGTMFPYDRVVLEGRLATEAMALRIFASRRVHLKNCRSHHVIALALKHAGIEHAIFVLVPQE